MRGSANAQFPVTVTVDASKTRGELKPVRRMFGTDEPNYATMKDGKKLLAELAELRPGDLFGVLVFGLHSLPL